MKNQLFTIFIFCSLLCCRAATIDNDKKTESSFSVKLDYTSIPKHPRLFMKAGEEELIKESLKKNPAMANLHNHIISYCNTLLTKPPKPCSGSGRGVAIARETLKNVFWLSYAYRTTGLKNYAVRAEDEMVSICGYDDWAPEHYLDVAERLLAMAIGYDWLYNVLSEPSRKLILENIKTKGLKPAYNKEYNEFFGHVNNWNPVCTAGITTVCLAVYEEMPEMAEELIDKCIKSNLGAINEYGPNGGYPEGYTYWGYGTSFQVMLIDALEGVLGTSGGITEYQPAFYKSARYAQFLTTPARNVFSYSDSETKAICSAINFWFAYRNNDTTLIYLDMKELNAGRLNFSIEERHAPLVLLYASKLDLKSTTAPTENYWLSRGTAPIFVYRAGWNKDSDAYLGVKAGKANSPHGHMDAGSFIYEKNGVSWAIDLGTFSYGGITAKGISLWDFSQNGDRWKVFRTAAISHNTLTINDNRHNVYGYTDFTQTYKTADKKGVQVDMTPALNNELTSATRNIWLDANDFLHVEDLVKTGSKSANVKWIMCTAASVKVLDNNKVSLEYNSKEMLLEIESPNKITCEILSNVPTTDYDPVNPGTCRVCVNMIIPANTESRIKVKLTDL